MKIVQLLESPRDELALQQIAKSMYEYIASQFNSGQAVLSPSGNTYALHVFKIGSLPKGSWGHLYTVVKHTEVFARFRMHGVSYEAHGEYFPRFNTMNFDVGLDKDGKIANPEDTISTIVHELRHRLDDSRSRGKAFDTQASKGEYLKQSVEINARFSQIVAELVGKLKQSWEAGSVLSAQDFIRLFEEKANAYNLMDVFKYEGGSAPDTFIQFVSKGIFGRHMAPELLRPIVQKMTNKPDDQPVGPTGDKQYRRLLSRLVLIYNTAVAQWSKEAK